jgi:hypothetical protein
VPRRQVARQPRLGAVRHVQQDQPVAVPLPVERRRDRERAVADGGAVDGDADGHALVGVLLRPVGEGVERHGALLVPSLVLAVRVCCNAAAVLLTVRALWCAVPSF